MRRIMLLALVLALAGCSPKYLELKYGDVEPKVVIKEDTTGKGKKQVIYAWNPYANVIVGNPETGEVCMLPADGAKVAKTDRGFGLGITGAAGSFAGANISSNSTKDEKFTLIALEDTRGAAAENSLSTLCLFRLNRWIESKDLKEMYLLTLKATMGAAEPKAGEGGEKGVEPAKAASTKK